MNSVLKSLLARAWVYLKPIVIKFVKDELLPTTFAVIKEVAVTIAQAVKKVAITKIQTAKVIVMQAIKTAALKVVNWLDRLGGSPPTTSPTTFA